MAPARTPFMMLSQSDNVIGPIKKGLPLDPPQKEEILNFPLIAQYNTSLNLDSVPIDGESIYFGTGVVTSKAIGHELPFDILSMLLTAEWVRRKTGGREVIHEISDSHALTNPLHDRAEITRIAQKQRELYTKAAFALGMEDFYRCVLASEYRSSKAFAGIQEEIDRLSPDDTAPYMRYQSAGNLYFARHENVSCKIGWLVDDNETPTGLDERTFNYAYAKLGVRPIPFLYTWSGWNFDIRRSRVSPYTVVKGEKRLMLQGTRSAQEELRLLMADCDNEKICRQVITHIARIVTSYDLLFKSFEPSVWSTNSAGNSPHFIEAVKPEPWHLGQYINLETLSQRVDKIRSMSRPAFDTDLLHAVQQYMVENRER